MEDELTTRESELGVWESTLQQLQAKMQGIEEREKDLQNQSEKHKQMEDEFFNVKVASITARHMKEMNEMEKVVEQQLQIVATFQIELEKSKEELVAQVHEKEKLEVSY